MDGVFGPNKPKTNIIYNKSSVAKMFKYRIAQLSAMTKVYI